jgi:hypothetical protein
MTFRAAALVVTLGLASTSCQVITESMPPASVVPPGFPTSDPGAIRTATPLAPSGPLPQPQLPAPQKTKTPKPEDPPDSEPTNIPGCPKSWPPSCQPVASVGVVTFWVLCGSNVVPNSKYATTADAACQVKLDATPKDASRTPTQSHDPVWSFGMGSSAYWVGWGGGAFNPTVHGEGAKGQFTATATVDGVRSNDLVFYFQ